MPAFNWTDFYEQLRSHRAVDHPLFTHLESHPYDQKAWRTFVGQHNYIVQHFPSYLQILFQRLLADQVSLIQVVLDDELAEGSVHIELQSQLCRDLGINQAPAPLLATRLHVHQHLHWMNHSPIDFALGALGPGHEAVIPTIFRRLISGAPPSASPAYLFAHLAQDPVHDAKFRELIEARTALDPDAWGGVVRGALASLDVRAVTWDAIFNAICSGEENVQA